MDYSFADCVLLNTVMAARAMTRRYDEKLKPFGVSVIQFSILATLGKNPERPVSAMADALATDRTTLLRNLQLLERRNLVTSSPRDKGNGRDFELSDEGHALLAELLPHWQNAQKEVRALLQSSTPPDQFLASLRSLTSG